MRRTITILSTLVMLVGLLASPVSAAPAPPTDAGAGAPDAALSSGQVQLQLITSGLSSPIGIANAGDGTGRLFVVEQGGTVRVVSGTSLQAGTFLDIRSGAPGGFASGGERGLLGLAFHPSFESNEKLFVFYTRSDGDLVIAEMTANASRTSASVTTLDPILTIEHSSLSNHNGGQLLFGPDGYLYAFTGDGGGGGDPGENAQDVNELLGKTLRIAPDLNGSYTSPASNPFVGVTGRDEIWATGLRNPWRASFDRGTGNLWTSDVGEARREEINRGIGNPGGLNYGWDRCEGSLVFEGPGPCNGGGLTGPTAEYSSESGSPHCSVTGGYVYRGGVFRDFVGQYVLGDYCSGYLWTLPAGAGSPSLQFHQNSSALISSFGESEVGEIYMTDHAGRLYRVVAPPFSDVASSIFIDAITWLYYEGITGGCGGGRFCPTATVTRAEMASFLVRALGLPPSGNDFFTDDEGSIHENDINALAAAGITGGCTSTRYCPTAQVTRQQMASFLVRAFDLPPAGSDFFTDDEGSIHENDINALAAAGITGGCTATTFCPFQAVTREQMAAFLMRALT